MIHFQFLYDILLQGCRKEEDVEEYNRSIFPHGNDRDYTGYCVLIKEYL